MVTGTPVRTSDLVDVLTIYIVTGTAVRILDLAQ
jgi:hypothetical protein